MTSEKKKLETPLWGELDDVYEPSEDSFLLLDTLEAELPRILSLRPGIVLEIGSGSGVVVTALARALGPTSHCIAVDINPKASLATSHTAFINNAQVDSVVSDLCSCIGRAGMVDLLVFNPPYVVTPYEEIQGGITRAWAGGIKGRQVTDRLLYQLSSLMSSNCIGYMVAIEENLPKEMTKILIDQGFSVKTIARRKVPGENLSVLCFKKTQ